MGIVGRFPFDQEQFVLTCVLLGLDQGLLAEIRRTPGARDE
jgi:hypothetical protein